jgi:EAL domain-containing protein (putative c-di-GMP-specific phosphodiesterase class I)
VAGAGRHKRRLRELARLHDNGISIALDDFGTGYSSLSRLWQFPIDIIKIDRTFVAELVTSQSMRAIVATIINLARAMGSTTIAEGIESPAQLDILRDLGCHQASGYLLCAPTPIPKFLSALARGERFLTPQHAGPTPDRALPER